MPCLRIGAVLACLLFSAMQAAAHHSFAAEYDAEKPVKLSGVVARIEWLNPHIWIYLDVTGPDGTVTRWALSAGSPGQFLRRGVRKEALPPGTALVVDGYRAKDGSSNAYSSRITWQDGRSVVASGVAVTPGAVAGGKTDRRK